MGTGNTRIALNDIVDEAVQPRGYGEHVAFISSTNVQGGSAPWVRGTPIGVGVVAKFPRFSPVGTGNTLQTLRRKGLGTVQPRGYGEHSKRIHLFYITM